MPKKLVRSQKQLLAENENLRARLAEAEETLRAIRGGEVDALVASGVGGGQISMLPGAEESYRMLIEQMSEGALTLTEPGVILYANRRFAEMLKTPLEKVIGSMIQIWVAPAGLGTLQSLLRRGRDEKRPQELELTAGDGTQVPVLLALSPLLMHDTPDSFCAVATDLTEQKRIAGIVAAEGSARELLAASHQSRIALLSVIEDQKRAEEELEKERVLLRTLIDSLPDRVYAMDLEGRKILSNKADWQASGGTTMEDVIGKKDVEIYPPELGRRYWDLDKDVLDTGAPIINLEESGLDHDGNPRVILTSKVPLRDALGKVTGLVGVGRDITARKQAEQQVQYQASLLQEVNDAIVASDAQDRLTAWNPAAEALYGWKADEVLGRNGTEIVRTEWPGQKAETMRDRIAEAGRWRGEATQQRKDDTRFPVELSRYVSRDAHSKITGHISVARDISERKRAEQELRSRTEEISALYYLSSGLATAADLGEVLELVNRHAVGSLHLTFARIALLEGSELVTQAGYPIRVLDHDLLVGDRRPIAGLPLCQRALESQESTILRASDPEIGADERAALLLDFAQSVDLIPLRVGHAADAAPQNLGLLMLGEARNEDREPFTPEKMHLAQSIADQAASAIRRMLLRDETRRRLRQVVALHTIDSVITGSTDLHMIMNVILEQTAAELGVDAASILVLNPHTQILGYAADHGFRTNAIRKAQVRLGESYAGRVALQRQLVQVPDLAAEPNNPLLKSEAGEDFACYYGVPLIAKGQVKGVLEVFNRTVLHPDAEWLGFLNALAGQAAIAIDSSALSEGLQRSNLELSAAYDATIEGWSHALDLRDRETEGHTQRVTDLTVALARSCGLSEAELVQVRWGSLLHDIGKMGVPDSILLKPGPLTDEEWVAMKKHPTFAYEMLAPIHYLRQALDIPYCHHEKWDGTGYPRGLKGEQIPLTARVFAVVDVWDALNSDRPYRRAWTREKTLEHIRAGAGTHFDPQVVEAFLHMLPGEGAAGTAWAPR